MGAQELIVRRAVAAGREPWAVIRDLRRQLASSSSSGGAGGDGPFRPTLVFAFSSWRLDPDVMASGLNEIFAPATVIGCTSHGEIGGGGDYEGAAVVMAIGSPHLRVAAALAPDLRTSALRSSRAAVVEAAERLGLVPEQLDARRHVAVTLVDGRSGVEESFCMGSAATAPQIRFVGGSASDGLAAQPATRVFFGGRAHADVGVVALIESELPFTVIESEHMVPTQVRVVVTSADPDRRRVVELDGFPAVTRYRELVARLGGPRVDDVVASSFPFAIYIGGKPYVRSVVRVDEAEQALVLAAAVDPGAVLRIMQPGDLVGSTVEALAAAEREVGGRLGAVIAFSCLGRHREAITRGERAELAAVYDRAPLIGFHSLGEQAGALLVNHTLTGLVLGAGRA